MSNVNRKQFFVEEINEINMCAFDCAKAFCKKKIKCFVLNSYVQNMCDLE